MCAAHNFWVCGQCAIGYFWRIMIYSEIIRKRRLELGLTQQEVADRMGKHINTYSKLERGLTRMNSDYAGCLNEVLGLSIPEVFGYGTESGVKLLEDKMSSLNAVIEEKDKEIQRLTDKARQLEDQVERYRTEAELLRERLRFYENREKDTGE